VNKLTILLAISLLLGCTDQPRQANLKFTAIEGNGNRIEIEFSADVNLNTLFSENRTQRQVLSELICSLNGDTNFDFEHRLEVFSNGRVMNNEISSGNQFIFKSALLFWRSPKNELDSDVMLTSEEVERIISRQDTIPCLYRTTVYLARPYYTKKMHVPTNLLRKVIDSGTLQN
jgi:hypothetical protein